MNRIIKIAAVLAGLASCAIANAQITPSQASQIAEHNVSPAQASRYQENAFINEAPHEAYCELVALNSVNANVNIDLGQGYGIIGSEYRLIDYRGAAIRFNNLLDALNYMAERGWRFEQAYEVRSVNASNRELVTYHWLLSKTVTSPAEVTFGLRIVKKR